MPLRPRSSALARALACGSVALLGCSGATGPERELSGQVLYDQYCARCHGLDGVPIVTGTPNLADPNVAGNLNDSAIRSIVRTGRPPVGGAPGMPAFKREFTDASLGVLVAYVRTLSPSAGSPADAE